MYHLALAVVVFVRNNLVTALSKEALTVSVDILRKPLRPMDVQLPRPPKHREGRKQPRQTKAMVTVEMGNKNSVNASEMKTLSTNLELGTLATVHQVDLTSKGKCLSGWIVLCSRESRTTTQYMYR